MKAFNIFGRFESGFRRRAAFVMPIRNIDTGHCKNGGIANSAKPLDLKW